jgi:glycosyltransferase involved in cell wall biosynthesis
MDLYCAHFLAMAKGYCNPARKPAVRSVYMKFSIIVPLYNKAPYVKLTLESVLAQTLADFEVIVIDDGSSDGSGDIVAAFSDPRVILVRQPNAGVSAARNHGIRLARGEWVAFLDADDWLDPQYLATQWATASKHPNVSVVATQFVSSYLGDECSFQPIEQHHSKIPVEIVDDLAARWEDGGVICTCSVAVRASALNDLPVHFPLGESCGEDLDLWFRLNEQSAIALALAKLVVYRRSLPGSLTTNEGANTSEPPFLGRIEQRVADGTMPKRLRQSSLRLVNMLRIASARRAIEHRRRRDALWLLWRARKSLGTHQWWLTVVMVVMVPASLVGQWQRWRFAGRMR